MTSQSTAPGPESVLLCARCGTASPHDARICRRCYASLEGAESTAERIGAERRRRMEVGWPSTTRGWATLALAAVVLFLGAWWLRGWLSGPPAPLPAVLGARAVAAPGEGWALPGGDLDGTRRTPALPRLDTQAGWHWAASSPPSTTLTTDGDALYVGLEEGVLVAVDTGDGAERWRVGVPGVLESAPAVAEGRLFVGYRSGSVAALDPETGETLWETQLGVSISTTPVVVDGIVFVAGNGVLGGFDAEDGTLIWRQPISDNLVPASPVVDGDMLVVATFDRVLLFDRRNGQQLTWATFAPQYAPIAAVAIEDGLILATADGQLMAVETSMRRPWWDGIRRAWEFLNVVGAAPDPPWRPDRWTVAVPAAAYPAAVTEDLVVVAAPSGIVRAHSRTDGAIVWEAALEGVTGSPVMTASGLLVAGTNAAWLLDLSDGSVVAEHTLGDSPLEIVPVTSATFVLTSGGVDAFSDSVVH